MNNSHLLPLIVVIALWQGGCASVPGQAPVSNSNHAGGPQATVSHGHGTAEAAASFPAMDLSADILYELLVADIAVQRQYYALAIDRYLSLAKRTGDPRITGMATRVAIYARDNRHALEAAELWVKQDPENAEARQAIIAALIRAGRPQDSFPHVDALMAMEDSGPDNGLRLISSLLGREQDIKAAMVVMEHVVAQEGGNAGVWLVYGQLAMRASDLEIASKAVDKALKLRPGWVDAILLHARLLQLRGDNQGAYAYLGKAVTKTPDEARLRLAYARLAMDEKQFEVALQQYEHLVKQAPDNDELKYTLGLLLLQMQRVDEAESYLKQIRSRGARFNDVNFYLGWIGEYRNNTQEAIDYYQAVGGGANYLEAGIRAAILMARQGDVKGARAQLERLRQEAPAHLRRISLVEGEILRSVEQYDEAMRVYDAALEVTPDDEGLLYARAILAEQMDRLDLMEQDLLRIIQQDPDNVDALNALGYTLADRTDRYEEAYGYIKRALELSPGNNAILDSMGWVLYRLGKYDEAIKFLRQSLKLKADYEVAAHLGEVLWVSGAQDEALEVWNQALEHFSGNKVLLDVIKRFSQ
ncbi:MAG TPA: tetratricopeptide repeat protein [Gammaproteobacteria bacterium]|nr:tetratricopeptide repeat protein [Gammaproteobacteria bacterium]